MLTSGSRLGPYEIVAPLGAGGMGEVYRARDPKLNRDVAIKVLPDALTRDADALERFEREARAVAALSHPNILAIHDLGRHDMVSFAVMELLEGETLREKVEGGAIPQRKAVEYAQQIAQGLAAAHEKGIVHRDLKPENLFVTHDGRVKILDFGLAKQEAPRRADEATSAPTATRHTDPGTVMGTVGYMSPEQVKGLAVDTRSDIFSFGTILYEMLSGARAFKRDTAPETLTAILREDPPEIASASRHVDPALDRLVRHCLEKSPGERFQSARDLAYALSTLSSGAVSGATGRVSAAGSPRGRTRLAVAGGAALGILLGSVVTAILLRPRPVVPPSFQVLTYSGADVQPAVSPDGRSVAFASTRDGTSRIWIKQLAGGAEAALTDGPDTNPRFSPDGASLLFTRGPLGSSAIYRVPIVGGQARKMIGPAAEADWSPDGSEIVFIRQNLDSDSPRSSIHRVSADGSNERLVATVPNHLLGRPRWSPDGRLLAVGTIAGTGTAQPRISVYQLDGGPPHSLAELAGGTLQGYSWDDSRHLVILVSGGTGFGEGAVSGSRTSRVFLQDIETGKASVLLSGTDLRGGIEVLGPRSLVIASGGPRSNLAEISLGRSGEGTRWLTRGSSVDRQPTYAPDGEWVAFSSNRSGNNDIWEVSTKSGAIRRLTDHPAEDFDPAFTADGKHLLFSSNRSGHYEIWMAERDGSGARQVTGDGVDAENASATPDGQWIVYASGNPEKRGVWKVHPDGSAARRLAAGTATLPEISPDGSLVSFLTGRPRMLEVVQLADGAPVAFTTGVEGRRLNSGRHRWMPDGGALAIQLENERGDLGVVMQAFAPGKDTAAARRPVAGFTPDVWTESLGISRDGARMTVAMIQDLRSLLLAEGVEGVVGRAARAR